jgi:hypothetical protein
LRIPNVQHVPITLDDIKSADFNQDEMNTLRLEEGDILVIRSNGGPTRCAGKCALAAYSWAAPKHLGDQCRAPASQSKVGQLEVVQTGGIKQSGRTADFSMKSMLLVLTRRLVSGAPVFSGIF